MTLGIYILAILALPLASRSQTSIGVNFAGREWSIGGNTPQSLNAADTAGVVGQQNWNNVDPAGADSGGLGQIIGPHAGVISDSSGTATSVTFSYAAQGMWSVNQASGLTGNQQLLNGYSDVEGSSATGTYNFGNLSYSLYNVYVYVSSDGNGRTGGVSINGGSQTFLLSDANGYDYATPLIRATATTQGSAASAQYVEFQNLTGSSFQVALQNFGSNVGVAGIQIVAVPEPSTMALAVAGGMALAGWIRRRRV